MKGAITILFASFALLFENVLAQENNLQRTVPSDYVQAFQGWSSIANCAWPLSSTVCSACKKGFALANSGKECVTNTNVTNPNLVNNCFSYDDTWNCTQCQCDYAFVKDNKWNNKQCVSNQFLTKFCQLYDTDGKSCLECKFIDKNVNYGLFKYTATGKQYCVDNNFFNTVANKYEQVNYCAVYADAAARPQICNQCYVKFSKDDAQKKIFVMTSKERTSTTQQCYDASKWYFDNPHWAKWPQDASSVLDLQTNIQQLQAAYKPTCAEGTTFGTQKDKTQAATIKTPFEGCYRTIQNCKWYQRSTTNPPESYADDQWSVKATCAECDDEALFVKTQDRNKCVERSKSADNLKKDICLYADNTDNLKCAECAVGYIKNANGKCIALIQKCQIYNLEGCEQCIDGYAVNFQGTECLSNYIDYETQTAQSQKSQPGCKKRASGDKLCLTVIDQTFTLASGQSSCAASYTPVKTFNYLQDSYTKCKPETMPNTIKNCQDYQTDKYCKTCTYDPQNTQSVKTNDQLYCLDKTGNTGVAGNNDEKIEANCISSWPYIKEGASAKYFCRACKDNNVANKAGACEGNANGCAQLYDTGKCMTCKPGYKLNGDSCTETVKNCITYDFVSGKCTTCHSDYETEPIWRTDNNQHCLTKGLNVKKANCGYYSVSSTESDTKCKQCNSDTYILKDNNCELRSSIAGLADKVDNKCQEIDANNKCLSCGIEAVTGDKGVREYTENGNTKYACVDNTSPVETGITAKTLHCNLYQSSECKQCKFTNDLPTGGKCDGAVGAVAHCDKYYDSYEKCFSCKAGYVLNINGVNQKCFKVDHPACIDASAAGTCTACAEPYQLYTFQNEDKATCIPKIAKCRDIDRNIPTKCSFCEPGFKPNADRTQCFFYVDNCYNEAISPDTWKSDKNKAVVSYQAEWFNLIGDQKCNKCSSAYSYEGTVPADGYGKCLANCRTFSADSKKCTLCKADYFLNTDDGTCQTRTIKTGCEEFNNNADKCNKCKIETYFKKNDGCEARTVVSANKCSEYSETSDQCKACLATSGTFQADGSCKTITECVEYSTDANAPCKKCNKLTYSSKGAVNPDFGLQSDSTVCLDNSQGGNVKGCKKYKNFAAGDPQKFCDQCHDNYFKVSDTKCEEGCKLYTLPQGNNNGKCTECIPSYGLLGDGTCWHDSWTSMNQAAVPTVPGCMEYNPTEGTETKPELTRQCTKCHPTFILVTPSVTGGDSSVNRNKCYNGNAGCTLGNCKLLQPNIFMKAPNPEQLKCKQCNDNFDENTQTSSCDAYGATGNDGSGSAAKLSSTAYGVGNDGGYTFQNVNPNPGSSSSSSTNVPSSNKGSGTGSNILALGLTQILLVVLGAFAFMMM